MKSPKNEGKAGCTDVKLVCSWVTFFCQNDLGLPELSDCAGTIEFLRVTDYLFDVLNSRNPLAQKATKPLCGYRMKAVGAHF